MATNIPNVPEYEGDVPLIGQGESTFSKNAQDSLVFQANLPVDLNTSIAAINVVSQEVEDAATAATAAANFEGNWSDLTGPYGVGISVKHDDRVWLLLVALSDITSSEPSQSNDDWELLPSYIDIVNQTAKNIIPVSQLVIDYVGGNISDGESVELSWYADGNVTNLTKDAYGNVVLTDPLTDTGVIYTEFNLGQNVEISSLTYSIMQFNGLNYIQIYGNGSNGISLTETVAGVARLSIDLTVLTGGFVVAGVSEQVGKLEINSLGSGIVKVHKFELSGTFTPNPLAKKIKFTLVGGGGGSGGVDGTGSNSAALAPGGGGGETSIKTISKLESSYSIIIAAGGQAGTPVTPGGGGGASSVIGDDTAETNMTAVGGGGSQSVAGSGLSYSRTPGAGGSGGVGADIHINGSDGKASMVILGVPAQTGDGGSSSLSLPRRAPTPASGAASQGLQPYSYGGGASGPVSWNTSSNANGADGADGVCIIEEFF